MDLPQLTELKNEKRRAIRPPSPTDPADALTSYYALWHDPRRTQLTLHYDDQRQADGFVTVSQTGVDLFRPLVTLRAPDDAAAAEAAAHGLDSNRPYYLIVACHTGAAVRGQVEMGGRA